MSLLEMLHGGFVHERRIQVLAAHFAKLTPPGARRVLDIGCGDGKLSIEIQRLRPDLELQGVDVMARPNSALAVTRFDGRQLPFGKNEFDIVMFADVLHHTEDPYVLLREAIRVARTGIIIKDHSNQGFLGNATLAFMDWIGNARHGVALPYNYWRPSQWDLALSNLGLRHCAWETKLGLYPFPANLVFERSLHFVAFLEFAGPVRVPTPGG